MNKVFLVQHPRRERGRSICRRNIHAQPRNVTGVMDDLRKAFASANKVDAGLFSFNSKGTYDVIKGWTTA